MLLSPHFSLAELTVTQHREIDNTPPDALIPALTRLAEGLERVRRVLGVPVLISSGYRSEALNKAVGGQPNSQHMKGEAADILAPAFGSPTKVANFLKSVIPDLKIDQLILEYPSNKNGGWVHVSFSDKPRQIALTIDATGTTPGIA